MNSFRKALAAILKSLVRGKSLLKAILAYCISPLIFNGSRTGGCAVSHTTTPTRTIQEFLKEAESILLDPVSYDELQVLSGKLKQQFLDRLQSNPECMLPSFSHQLPTGREYGQFLSLDVGGSTLRVALVELGGSGEKNGERTSRILSMRNFFIGKDIKDLEGMLFFDWMAARIYETLSTGDLQKAHNPDQPLPMALAWSFPIEQTSLSAGRLGSMGKGFMANKGLMGQDLGEILTAACHKQGLEVEVEAIINDSSACLLSQAYSHTSTRFGLILGTGVNVGAYLPVNIIGMRKFGARPAGWFDRASHVIVNTELSMFGGGILPFSRWDHQLRSGHSRPDFQPLELMTSGMYLGEVARFALIEAIKTTGIFGGAVPSSLMNPYALNTETLSIIESDTSSDLSHAIKVFSDRHPCHHCPTTSDMAALRSLASFISTRSSALIATCVYTLWLVRQESHTAYIASQASTSSDRLLKAAQAELALEKTVVAFNGSVIENYPGYLSSCQRFVDGLVVDRGSIELVPAKESSLLGAAVASACVKNSV